MPVEVVVYGKIIIDRMADGVELLGGGGPQAALGARFWRDSVGLLSRSGTDIGPHAATLEALGVDLSGWTRYPDLPTPRARLVYDDAERLVDTTLISGEAAWHTLLDRELPLPASYQSPRLIHLVTEYADEPMVRVARRLRGEGVLLSLEPIIENATWDNVDEIRALLPHVDIVSPDWPSACRLAGRDDPADVLEHWLGYGPTLVAIRRGGHGSVVGAQGEGQRWHVAPLDVEVVDPTGAGNAYSAALATAWLDHQDPRTVAARATAAAATLITRRALPPFTEALRAEAHAHAARVTSNPLHDPYEL